MLERERERERERKGGRERERERERMTKKDDLLQYLPSFESVDFDPSLMLLDLADTYHTENNMD